MSEYAKGYMLGMKHAKSGHPYYLPFGKHVDFVRGYKAGYYA